MQISWLYALNTELNGPCLVFKMQISFLCTDYQYYKWSVIYHKIISQSFWTLCIVISLQGNYKISSLQFTLFLRCTILCLMYEPFYHCLYWIFVHPQPTMLTPVPVLKFHESRPQPLHLLILKCFYVSYCISLFYLA